MCAVLKLPRSTYYYESCAIQEEDEITPLVLEIFRQSKNNYGTRKIKKAIEKIEYVASRRKIGRIMKENGLVSNYTTAQFKVYKAPCNESVVTNEVNQDFNNRKPSEVVVSDLTYVRVAGKWNYVCFILDLYNREIIGYSAGQKKDAALVYQAFSSVKRNLKDISIFHTDRGNEFKNKTIDDVMETFEIKRSLSKKGCPYDNAVAEATFKIFKTEFVYPNTFKTLDELKLMLSDYTNWFNNFRMHSTLGYLTPVEYRQKHLS
jgi:putative transposase